MDQMRGAAEQPDSLRERVLSRVRADIVAGQIKYGHVYSAPALATDLGISTTPVREALLELSRQGFVRPLRNRGFEVVEPSVTDLAEISRLRVVLESYAMDVLAADPPGDLDSLRGLADKVAGAVESGNSADYVDADRAFHLALVSRTGNARLTTMVLELRDQMRLFGIGTDLGVARQKASVSEHFEMLELIVAGDKQGAQELVARHISEWEAVYREAMNHAR